MERTSFVFLKEWFDALKGVPEKVRAEVYVAIVEYAFTGETPKLKSMGQMAFNFIQADIDRQDCQEGIKRARSCAGKKGAQAKWENVQNTDNEPEVQPKEQKKTLSMEIRKKDFYNSLIPYADRYGQAMINEFYEYWSEENTSKTKMRFELQKTWETSRRLSRWAAKINEYGERKRDNKEDAARQDALQIMQRIKSRTAT